MIITQALITATVLCLIWQLWWILPYTFLWPREVKTSSHGNAHNQLSILTSNVLTPNRKADALIELVKKHQPDVLVTLESDQWWEDKLKVIETKMPYSVKLTLPAPPSPTENPESAERDAELVIVARSVAESDQPVIVTGDLNDVAWSATTRLFRKISGLLDPRVGRGVFDTFHADYLIVRWPLDHLFHSQHFTLQDIQRLPSIGSDHFPLLTILSFTPLRSTRQKGIQARASEQRSWVALDRR